MSLKERYWVAFFSQTGSEIAEVSEKLGRWPDLVISDRYSLTDANIALMQAINDCKLQYDTIGVRPDASTYRALIPTGALVTLHGYLKIIPPAICEEYYILNGHPGLITKYPQLKGKDPQKKAFDLALEESGCVIHEVNSQIDGGKILAEDELELLDRTLEEFTTKLHDISVSLWVQILKPLLVINESLTITD